MTDFTDSQLFTVSCNKKKTDKNRLVYFKLSENKNFRSFSFLPVDSFSEFRLKLSRSKFKNSLKYNANNNSSDTYSIEVRKRANERQNTDKENSRTLLTINDFLCFIAAFKTSLSKQLKFETQPPRIVITGGGVFYFWKAGFVSYLAHHFDLSKSLFFGTSAGALVSALVLCGVDVGWGSRMAIRFALEESVWNRSYFLAGILKNLAERWLEYIIPEEINLEFLSQRLVLIAFRVFRFRAEGLCRFSSRRDLIDCLLASMHIPFYADGKAFTRIRGNNYVDGGVTSSLTKIVESCSNQNELLVIRCKEDDDGQSISKREYLQKMTPKKMYELMHKGFSYAHKLHVENKLKCLENYQTNSPGHKNIKDDPYFDFERIHDSELDSKIAFVSVS